MYNYYFNNDMYRSNTDLYRNQSVPSLFDPTVGYNNGNLFKNLYSEYKNYKPAILKSSNEREKILLDLSKVSFAAHELKLYLDLHPNDNSILALFNDYRKKAIDLKNDYESKYGVLDTSSDNLEEVPFAWENGIWPWEGKFNV